MEPTYKRVEPGTVEVTLRVPLRERATLENARLVLGLTASPITRVEHDALCVTFEARLQSPVPNGTLPLFGEESGDDFGEMD